MNYEKESLRIQIINSTKTNHILHMFLIIFFGIGLITWPFALLMNNHERVTRLRNLGI